MIDSTLQRSVEGVFKRLARFNRDRSADIRECTSCGTRFEGETTCPNCTSEIWRTKTIIPHVGFNLIVVLIGTGFGVLRRLASGEIEAE